MGRYYLRAVGSLGEGLVLAPERFDPRRHVQGAGKRRVGDLVELVTHSVSPAGMRALGELLVLDTTHAQEGFVRPPRALTRGDAVRSAKRRLLPGDVLVSRLRPYLRQIALADEALFALEPGGNAVCASTEFFVLRGREGFDAAALVPFLLSEPAQRALAAGQEGGHHPRFSRELLASLRVPEGALSEAPALAARVRALVTELRRATVALAALAPR